MGIICSAQTDSLRHFPYMLMRYQLKVMYQIWFQSAQTRLLLCDGNGDVVAELVVSDRLFPKAVAIFSAGQRGAHITRRRDDRQLVLRRLVLRSAATQ